MQSETVENMDTLLDCLQGTMNYPSAGRDSFTLRINTEAVKGCFREIRIGDELSLSYLDVITGDSPFNFESPIHSPAVVEAGFALSGHVDFSLAGHRQDMGNFPGQGYLSCGGGDAKTKVSIPSGQHLRQMEIRYTPRSFGDYACYGNMVLPDKMLKRLDSEKEGFEKCTCILAPRLMSKARQICSLIDCSRESALLLEDLCLTTTRELSDVITKRAGTSQVYLSSADIERVREAYALLEGSLEDPPGLKELASLVNLNDFKLKKGFRQAYGTTVHQCLISMRLERAKDLIREEGCTVSEAASMVGFSNLGDFSMAFKKRYGVSPCTVRAPVKALK